MSDQAAPRVRFAPSPTGYLHVGGLRTALYNFLYARREGGTLILRIEDTDRQRLVEGAVENLLDTLSWTGITYDEGPGKGGAYGPYVQSERLDLYRSHVELLLKEKLAYYCFCTPERLDVMRKEQQKMRIAAKYDRTCLRLGREEVQKRLDRGMAHVVRMKVPESTRVTVSDRIRGEVEFQSDRLDDQVIMKSDGYPTYHLANVVDDHLMAISDVIRGEEWLPSTPKHVLLYEFFGWQPPRFAHLPLLLNTDRSKLSKRQGDVAVEEYRTAGYLPEALLNFVALLGWNPGDDREIFSTEQLVHEFSLDRVGKAGAIFNIDKLKWINQQHLRNLPDERILEKVKPTLERSGIDFIDDVYLLKVVQAMKNRLSSFDDFQSFAVYFFRDPEAYDETARKKNWSDRSKAHLSALAARIEKSGEFNEPLLEAIVKDLAGEMNVGAGKIIHAVRLALSGISIGPGLYELMTILGRETVLRRLRKAVDVLRTREAAP